MRRTPFVGNIIVLNLPETFSSGDLAALFDEFGLVLGAVISGPKDEAARSLRGSVNLAPVKAVEAAIAALDGRIIESHHLRVRKAPVPPPKVKAPRPAGLRLRRSDTSARESRATAAAEARAMFPAAPAPARAVVVERRSLGGTRMRRPLMSLADREG